MIFQEEADAARSSIRYEASVRTCTMYSGQFECRANIISRTREHLNVQKPAFQLSEVLAYLDFSAPAVVAASSAVLLKHRSLQSTCCQTSIDVVSSCGHLCTSLPHRIVMMTVVELRGRER